MGGQNKYRVIMFNSGYCLEKLLIDNYNYNKNFHTDNI